MNESLEFEESSGNVFADLNIPEPEQYLAKAQLAARICSIIQERGLTQSQAAEILHVNQPKISALMRGNLDGFSSDRLFRFLNYLDQEVVILIRPNPNPHCQAGIQIN
ncbi:MAG: helix-turn-helix domain-containing protein [Xenococcus sp. (in: cyanobacteria)]